MRYLISLVSAGAIGMLAMVSSAHADATQDCYRWGDDPDPAIEACTEAIRTHCLTEGRCTEDFRKPGLGRLFVHRALAYANIRGDYRRAISDFNEVIRIVPSDFPREINDAYCGRAFAHIGLGEYDRAIASVDEYFSKYDVKRDTELGIYAHGFGLRGVAYSRKGEQDRAIEEFNVASRLWPSEPIWYMERGTAYTAKGWYDRAMKDHDKAIGMMPKSPVAYVRRGQTWEATRERERAIEDYNKALTFRAEVQWERDEQAVARRRLATLQCSGLGCFWPW
jgi:tetratricopeptide (TPR) repeat protein